MLAAWLGDINPNETRDCLEANGVPNFYTPENAVEAFSFLCAYQRNQAQLLQVPAALARAAHASAPDLAAARAILDAALAAERTTLTEHEAKALLRSFGLRVPPSPVVTTREAAVAAAREIGFPVALKIHSPDITHKTDVGGVRLNLQDEAMVAGAFDGMLAQRARGAARTRASRARWCSRCCATPHAREVLVGVATDAVFGPVISFGTGGIAVEAVRDTAVALPPLNAVLARELIDRTRVSRLLGAYRDVPGGRPRGAGGAAAAASPTWSARCPG